MAVNILQRVEIAGKFESLKEIDLRSNTLQEFWLTDELAPRLKLIDVQDNHLQRLWLDLRQLERLFVGGNPDITCEDLAKLNVPRLKELQCDNLN